MADGEPLAPVHPGPAPWWKDGLRFECTAKRHKVRLGGRFQFSRLHAQ